MSYNTKNILLDAQGKPIPQLFDPIGDVYRALLGVDLGSGIYAPNSVIWGKKVDSTPLPVLLDASGRIIVSVNDVPLATGAASAALQTQIDGHVDNLETLVNTLNTLVGEVSATPTAYTMQSRLKDLQDKIAAVIAGTSVAYVSQKGSTLIELNLTLNGSAQQLTANACRSFTLQAEPGNKGYVYVGKANTVSASVHSYVLSAGSSIAINCSNTNLLWVFGTSGDKICGGGEV